MEQHPPPAAESTQTQLNYEDHRLTLFIASSSIIILTLILIIAVVSCFILCQQEKENLQVLNSKTLWLFLGFEISSFAQALQRQPMNPKVIQQETSKTK